MKEKVVLIPIEELSYSQEIFLQEESKVQSCIIWIIAALFFVIGCWITFGKYEPFSTNSTPDVQLHIDFASLPRIP